MSTILQNVGHHLVGAGRLEDLKQLLASPGWLERKLHSYGTASAVADFRRWVSYQSLALLLKSASHLLPKPSTGMKKVENYSSSFLISAEGSSVETPCIH